MTNPLLQTEGLPAFSAISPEHVEPALAAVLAENRAIIEAVTENDDAASWEEIAQPIERMEHRLARTWSPVSHLNAVVNNAELREVYNRCLPLLSEYQTEVGQNEALFRAYQRVAESADLTPVQRKAVDDALRDFRLSGVALSAGDKARFRDIMQRLTTLSARFEEQVLDATNAWSRHIKDEAELAGVPEANRARARAEAERRELPGWVLTLDFPTFHAVMAHAENRELREAMYRAWVTRASDQGGDGDRWDNAPVMDEIVRLRQEAARLLGLKSFAAYSLVPKMARDPEEVLAFLERLATRSRPAAERDMKELQTFANRPLEAWDLAFYAERLRRERHAISDEELRPYFPVHRVLDGLFGLVERLFGIRVEAAPGVDVWHDDVRYFRILDGAGQERGGFFTDLYARPHKRGGAWMDDCIGRMELGGTTVLPVAHLVCNFMPPVGGRPALLSHDEVLTLFHEFGHTLHHLLTRIGCPSVAGINGVSWDAVELPSQFMENFAWDREVLRSLSGHFETEEPLPGELLERLLGSRNFQSGMQMVRQLEFALFDFRLHSAEPPPQGQAILDLLDAVRRDVAVVPYPSFNRFPNSFSHIFGGGYAAGYYSYKWAEVLSADAFSAFEENPDGLFAGDAGRRFLTEILEVGGSVDALTAFVNFRGREPKIDALLRHSGIGSEEQATAA